MMSVRTSILTRMSQGDDSDCEQSTHLLLKEGRNLFQTIHFRQLMSCEAAQMAIIR